MNNNDKKQPATYRFTSDELDMLELIKNHNNLPTRKAAISEAIKFYYGYLSGSISQDYLCGTVGVKMEAALRRSDDHQARLLYKMSVQLNMLTRLLAKDKHVSKEEYDNSRRKAIQDVNTTKGIIDLYSAGLE